MEKEKNRVLAHPKGFLMCMMITLILYSSNFHLFVLGYNEGDSKIHVMTNGQQDTVYHVMKFSAGTLRYEFQYAGERNTLAQAEGLRKKIKKDFERRNAEKLVYLKTVE